MLQFSITSLVLGQSVPVKQPWGILVNNSHESNGDSKTNKTKQNTTNLSNLFLTHRTPPSPSPLTSRLSPVSRSAGTRHGWWSRVETTTTVQGHNPLASGSSPGCNVRGTSNDPPTDRQKGSQIDGLVQGRRNSIAYALELRLSYTNPSKIAFRTMQCHK